MGHTNKHIWNFSTVGGVKRVNLESGADLLHLDELDQKLWTALSCPVNGLEIDANTLKLIDKDGDDHIRVPEILEAVKWICSVLKNPDDLLKGANALPLSAINDQTDIGKQLISSAQVVLKNLGKQEASSISVEETSDTQKIFAGTPFNGDGLISEDSSNGAELKKIINEIILCIGSAPDRGGKQGISSEHVELFFINCNDYSVWYSKKENDLPKLAPFGIETEEAYACFCAVRSKINDFFIRCHLADFNPESADALNLFASQIESISSRDLSASTEVIAPFPLSKINSERSLKLRSGINPAWEKQMESFSKTILEKLFPAAAVLTETQWEQIKKTFEPYTLWQNEKPVQTVEQLGSQRIREIITGNNKAALLSLIDKDNALAAEANNIILLDQLTRYYRDLFLLLRNFVTFFDFYSPDAKAVFQSGTLYIDQRSLDLCIRVNDMSKQDATVSFSGMYLIYCRCTSKKAEVPMIIVAALTNGDIDNLTVGRNALFYDREGKDWDASVIKIIENPISIRQAFWMPYRRLSRFIENQINKFATEKDNKLHSETTQHVEDLPQKMITAPPAPPAPFDVGKFVGIFAAIGLALGAIGTVLASITSGFFGLVWWKMPFAIFGILLIISGPPMIIAFFRLRKRNLAPLLDANGWAINANAIVNIHFGNTLTHLAALPKGARINLNDPFTKKSRPLYQTVLMISVPVGILLYLLIRYGWINIHF